MIKTLSKSNIVHTGHQIGGKASQLGKLHAAGFNVPEFVVLPYEFLQEEVLVDERRDALEQIDSFQFSIEMLDGLLGGLNRYSHYSVRSSAVGEDGDDLSYAGLFESFLYVTKSNLSDAIKKVWKSAYSERVDSYRRINNVDVINGMAVIIQVMIPADKSGVMFGVNPVTGEPTQLVSAVYGLGEGLVSGMLNSDNYYCEEGVVVRRHIAQKSHKVIINKEQNGTTLAHLENTLSTESVLNTEEIKGLVRLLSSIEEMYKTPQDVEWCIHGEEMYILQSRPITTSISVKEESITWDNSNIVESYPGLTLPLTFSFITDMYKVVYTQFSKLLGVRSSIVEANDRTFANMLGLLRGRVYYNLHSWYKVLSLLPGYRINAGFMETMMGVKDRLHVGQSHQQSLVSAWTGATRAIIKSIVLFTRLRGDRRKFHKEVGAVMQRYRTMDLSKKSATELTALYRDFKSVLTNQWNPPLVNDFFAMIYFGIFNKVVDKWIGVKEGHLHNDLLTSSNDIISVAPMRRSMEITHDIILSAELKELFLTRNQEVILKTLRQDHVDLYVKINEYLDKYGDRCYAELKLESISYRQDPLKYISLLQSYVRNSDDLRSSDIQDNSKVRTAAEQVVSQALRGKPFKRVIFRHILSKTRDLVSNRENLRFERTRGFAIVRDLFVEIGKRFWEHGKLMDARDIFYLTKEEVFDFIEGKSVNADLKVIISLRKEAYAKYESDTHLPERITINGMADITEYFSSSDEAFQNGNLKGTACSPGQVQGEVRIVTDPTKVRDLKGQILVAASTDPGWVALFPTASAIIVQRGSLLSHTAIVARELGIPCIVGVDNVLNALQSGDIITMNGSTGSISLIQKSKK